MFLARCNKSVVILAVILLLIVPSLAISSTCAKADTRMLMFAHLFLNDSEISVNISSSNDTLVNLTGYVIGDLSIDSTTQKILVQLFCDVQGSYECNVTPRSIALSRQVTNQSFNVSLVIPNGTTSLKPIIVNISGRIGPPNTFVIQGTNTVTATIHVNQYYDFSLECNKPKITIQERELGVFQMRITNLGNGQDNILLYVSNNEELYGKKVVCMLSASDIMLIKASEDVVKLSVKLPLTSDLEKMTIHLTAYSYRSLAEQNRSIERNLTLFVTITPDYTLEVALFCCFSIPVIIICFNVFIIILAIITRRKRKRC